VVCTFREIQIQPTDAAYQHAAATAESLKLFKTNAAVAADAR
jgi:hypothetical protein